MEASYLGNSQHTTKVKGREKWTVRYIESWQAARYTGLDKG